MTRMLWCLAVTLSIAATAGGQDGEARPDDEAAIRKSVADYVTAYNARDAETLASLWTASAVYQNPITGEQAIGRDAIRSQFAELFESTPPLKLAATTRSIDFISPSVALESGTAVVTEGENEPAAFQYRAIYVRQEDRWLLDRVTEEAVIEDASHYEQLKPLSWMVGRWVDADEAATVILDCHWSRNRNFLVRPFTIEVEGLIDMAGLQLIGWDPAEKTIRSWVFDSDGGFGEGLWRQDGDRWYVQQSGVLAGGGKSSSVNILTYVDDDNFTLQSINRMLDGKLLPNLDEVNVTREATQ